MRFRLRPIVALTVLSASLYFPTRAQANCSANAIATSTINDATLASVPLSDAQYRDPNDPISYNDARTYLAKGNVLAAYYNNTTPQHQAGSAVSSFSVPAFPRPLAGGAPALVPLGQAGALSIIVASGSVVYRLRASDGAIIWSYDTARPTCGGFDTINAQPAVVVRQYTSNPNAYPDDLIYVSTCYSSSCGSGGTTTNRIIALRGSSPTSTGVVQWTSPSIHGCGSGATLDYESGSLWYTYQRPSAGYRTLEQLNAATGATLWFADAGDIRVPPKLRNGRVYVGEYNASLRVYNIASSQLELISPLAIGTTLTQPFWVENRNEGGYANMVLTVTQNGFIQSTVINNDATGSQIVPMRTWSSRLPGGISAASAPSLVASLGKLYVGGVNGVLYQLTASNGAAEATSTIGMSTVNSASFDFVGEQTTNYPNRVVVSAQLPGATRLKSLCIPWAFQSSSTARQSSDDPQPAAPQNEYGSQCLVDADCFFPQWQNTCSIARCIDGACSAHAVEDGTACTQNCEGEGVCSAGTCNVIKLDTSVNCVCDANMPVGGLGCGPGAACCSQRGCVGVTDTFTECGNCDSPCPYSAGRCKDGLCDDGGGTSYGSLVSIENQLLGKVCSGVILTNDTVLTSAGCITYLNGLSGLNFVRAGFGPSETTVYIANSVTHPSYDFISGQRDVGVIFVATPFTFSQDVGPATLSNNTYWTEIGAQVYGYQNDPLMGEAMEVIDDPNGFAWGDIFAATESEKPCYHHNGEPMQNTADGAGYVVAIHSSATGDCDAPSYWTRIANVLPWIEQAMIGNY